MEPHRWPQIPAQVHCSCLVLPLQQAPQLAIEARTPLGAMHFEALLQGRGTVSYEMKLCGHAGEFFNSIQDKAAAQPPSGDQQDPHSRSWCRAERRRPIELRLLSVPDA